MGKMNRDEAIAYLVRKGYVPGTKKLEKELEKIEQAEEEENTEKFTEKDVQKIMKKGKIFGDPTVVLNY